MEISGHADTFSNETPVKMHKHLTNRSSQPLAVPMSSFHMTSTSKSAAQLALASGG
jgi:hypothetical protein